MGWGSSGLQIKRHRASVLVLMLPMSLALIGLMTMTARWFGVHFSLENKRIGLAATVQSWLAVHCDALQSLAVKVRASEPLIDRADDHGLLIPSRNWTGLRLVSQQLRASIPGYKGRLSSSLTVLSQANFHFRPTATSKAAEDFLAVVPEGVVVRDDEGGAQVLPGLWLKAKDSAKHGVTVSIPVQTAFGAATVSCSGRIEWTGYAGQQGYPETWMQAVSHYQFRPVESPYYRVVLDDL